MHNSKPKIKLKQNTALRNKDLLAVEEEQNRTWGVPNWRVVDGYPKQWDDLNPHEQKWEFLRRNQTYRSNWLRFQNAKTKKEQATLTNLYADSYNLKKLIDPRQNWENFNATFSTPAAKACGPYPIIKESREFLISMGYAKQEQSEWDKKLASLADKMGAVRDIYGLKVMVEFNLEYSAIGQARFVEKRLVKMQKARKALMQTLKQPKNDYVEGDYVPIIIRERNRASLNKKTRDKKTRKDYAPILLRIFDAVNCGRTQNEIIEILTEDNTLGDTSWDQSTLSRKIAYVHDLWRQM